MTAGRDTIFAVSSGVPPAAISVIRISGPAALETLETLAGAPPPERQVALRALHDADGDLLDHALVFWAGAPGTATGEELAELHVHGGRAVVAAVLNALGAVPGLRIAEAGEFTRRAFANGRIDLAEAEGLADLLSAETEMQRRGALRQLGGSFSRVVERWRGELLILAAEVEARIEFDPGEDPTIGMRPLPADALALLAKQISDLTGNPPVDRLRDGINVVIAGSPNAGKSSLLNALSGREMSIVSDVPGTTRDIVEAPVSIAGIPFVLRDTAGLRYADDVVEREGVNRAQRALAEADIVLWLDDSLPSRPEAIRIQTKIDIGCVRDDRLGVSALTGQGLEALRELLKQRATTLLPGLDQVATNSRQQAALTLAAGELVSASCAIDELLVAEFIRSALAAFDRAVGASTTEDMLDALFGSFCIGK